MASSTEWDRINRDILSGLDIAAEYAALGVKLGSRPASDKGWLECHAIDHEQSTSAAINVGDGPARGRYRDLGGQGWSLSLWDFAVKFGKFTDWKEARREYATKAGVKLARGAEPKSPLDQLDFQPWSDLMILGWCKIKGGIAPDAVKLAGARAARWPKKSREGRSVIALPAFSCSCGGQDSPLDADPCGWVILDSTGASLQASQGPGKPTKSVKILTVAGSCGGLINAHALARLATAEIVWKCEGVSDMLALQSVIPAELRDTHVCLTNSGGTLENVRPEWVRHFAGKRIFVVHDADRPGQLGSKKWVAALYGVASEVRDVQLPYEIAENHGKDLRDYLSVGHVYADALDMAESTPPARPEATVSRIAGFVSPGVASGAPGETLPGANSPSVNGTAAASSHAGSVAGAAEHHILALLQLDPLGEYRDHSIEVFSAARHKLSRIANVGRMSYADLLQIGGQPIEDYVHEGRTPIPEMHTLAEVKNAIAKIGGDFRLSDTNMLGAGCWRGQPELWKGGGPADEAMPVIVVDSDKAGVWNGVELEIVTVPRVSGRILDFEPGQRWCNFEKLSEYLKLAEGPWAKDLVNELQELMIQWRWKENSQKNATIVSGLILACWVQSVWAWRPEIFVTGPVDSGKSILFGYLAKIFGRLGMFFEKATEAGVRQSIRNRSVVVVIDEFEQDFHRQRILDLFRTSGRGGMSIRGTSDQKGKSFSLSHIPWFGAVMPNLRQAADQSRFIVLTLRDAVEGDVPPNIPDGPGSDDLIADFGLRLLAVAIRHAGKASRLASAIKRHKIDGVRGRMIESYSVPAAMLTVVQGGWKDEAISNLEDMLKECETAKNGVHDEIELLSDILESHIDAGFGKRASVGQILNSQPVYYDFADALERNGIALVDDQRGPRVEGWARTHVFFNPRAIARHLLFRTRWAEVKIDELLYRIKGAKQSQVSIGGSRVRGAVVHRSSLLLESANTQDAKSSVQTEVQLEIT